MFHVCTKLVTLGVSTTEYGAFFIVFVVKIGTPSSLNVQGWLHHINEVPLQRVFQKIPSLVIRGSHNLKPHAESCIRVSVSVSCSGEQSHEPCGTGRSRYAALAFFQDAVWVRVALNLRQSSQPLAWVP